MGAILCVLAVVTTLLAVRQSNRLGLLVVFAWGFFYGILRANFLDSFTHFMFDASLITFYCNYDWKLRGTERERLADLKAWFVVLVSWALFVSMLPLQHPLITLVGLRGNLFFLPLLFVGARLTKSDLQFFSMGLAVLNLVTLAFALAEYSIGVKQFFPYNAVTQIIYDSNDVAGYKYLRIPSTFGTAHAFGGAMAATIPLLFGAFSQAGKGLAAKLLLCLGMLAALVGVLLSSTRVNFMFAAVLAVAAVLTAKMSSSKRLTLIASLAILTLIAGGNERLSRFKSLGSSDTVTSRLSGSVNETFWEIATDYPMGNGMGGGGTSVPFFLAALVRRPVGMESEYARILLEQGIPGLVLWLSFLVWIVVSSKAFQPGPWRSGRILAWFEICFSLVGGAIGLGMMTAIPQSLFFLIYIGWIAAEDRNKTEIALTLPTSKNVLESRSPAVLSARSVRVPSV